MNQDIKLKYFIYARKSSEDKSKQIQSIQSQIEVLQEYAKRNGLQIVGIMKEEKSGKTPGIRAVFHNMLQLIEKGEANAILVWKLDRIARNLLEGGRVIDMLQNGIIQEIRTPEERHLPTDNVYSIAIQLCGANQYSRDLSINVKRGLNDKIKKGWRPGTAPEGYLNSKTKERGANDILIDPQRFQLVRKMWDLMLTGNYTPPHILDIANNKWGYRTRITKRKGNKPLSRSAIYRIFTNPFYAGIFYWGKEKVQYEGIHQKMITLEEFDRVQKLLGRKGKPRPKTHRFAYTGSLRCAECGCLFTAIEKEKLIKSTNEIKKYTYYFCTRKKKTIKCSQKKVLTEQDLELQIKNELEKFTILPEFLHWALEILNEKNDKEIEDRSKIYETQQKAVAQSQKELDELTKMRYRLLIDDETFLKEKKELQSKIGILKQKLNETESRAERWLELTEKTFNFATYARQRFLTGGLELKKEILMTLGQNPVIREGKLVIEPNEWLQPIKNGYPALEAEYLRLEPIKMAQNRHKMEVLSSIRTQWRGQGDLNP